MKLKLVLSAVKKTALSVPVNVQTLMNARKIADLGVTMLAAGIGNIHGKYPENWAGLSFETLAC